MTGVTDVAEMAAEPGVTARGAGTAVIGVSS